MSNQEIDKWRVIEHVINHRLTWPEAATQLDLSVRQIARLLVRVRGEGGKGLAHRLRGRASNHRLDPGLLREAVRLVDTRYRDFGSTFANEKFKNEHGIHLSTFTFGSLNKSSPPLSDRDPAPHAFDVKRLAIDLEGPISVGSDDIAL